MRFNYTLTVAFCSHWVGDGRDFAAQTRMMLMGRATSAAWQSQAVTVPGIAARRAGAAPSPCHLGHGEGCGEELVPLVSPEQPSEDESW